MTDAEINDVVHKLANHLSELTNDDIEAIISASFGLLAHCADSFGMENATVHSVLADILAQRGKS